MGVDITDFADPEMQESMKYLVTPMAEKIRLQSLPFDGKKACWVPEHKDGFIAGEIVGQKGDLISVKDSKGTVSWCGNIWISLVELF